MVNFIVVLSVLVLFHELGHYVAARYFGVTVESFSIGFGPRILGIKKNGTDFKVCLLPLGGYVKMAGSTMVGPPTGDPGELTSKPRWQRLVIASMGPIFNFILAVGLLAGLYMYSFEQPVFLDEEARLGYVRPGSPAATAGLQPGDVIRSLDAASTATWKDLTLNAAIAARREVEVVYDRNGVLEKTRILIEGDDQMREPVDTGWSPAHRVRLGSTVAGSPAAQAGLRSGDMLASVDGVEVVAVEQFIQMVAGSEGRRLEISIDRDGERKMFSARANLDEASGNWRLGVMLGPQYESVNEPLAAGQALERSMNDNYGYAGLILQTLKNLFLGNLSLKTLEGPVGIYRHTQDAAAYGLGSLIQLMALISVNLGIINLMPIPVLDGGHIVLLTVESLLQRDVSEAMRNRITQAGMVFILLLFGMVMYNDVMRQIFSP